MRLLPHIKELTHKLGRPVCSADLSAHFARSSDYQPMFLQSLGQVLIKTARARSQDAIYRIGVVGRFAYYATDTSSHWAERLESHATEIALERQVRANLPFHLDSLWNSEFEQFGRNALAGFCTEWECKVARCQRTNPQLAQSFTPILRAAKKRSNLHFIAREPRRIVSRLAAAGIIRTEHSRLVASESHLSLQRHLAVLRWPQSDLFERDRPQCFSDLQVRCYCLAKWPLDPVIADTAKAIFLCLSYGTGNSEALIEQYSRF